MSNSENNGMTRRRFMSGSVGVLAAPLLVPHVFAAPGRPDVVVVKGGSRQSLEEAAYRRLAAGVERFGGLKEVVGGKRVLIKLNGTERTSQDANTSPEATHALLRLCMENGCGRVTVLGQEWGGFDSPRAGRPTLRQVIRKAGADIVELPHYWVKDSAAAYRLTDPQEDLWHELWVAKDILAADTVLINLARLKTHPHCVFTGCIKNVVGLTRRMYGFHTKDDAAPPKSHGDPADSDGWDVFSGKLGTAFRDVIGPRIVLNILDAGRPTFGWRGPAPERIQTFEADATLVGTDALAMDVYGCAMLHAQRPDVYVEPTAAWTEKKSPYVLKNKTETNYLIECGQLGVGQVDLAKADIEEVSIDD